MNGIVCSCNEGPRAPFAEPPSRGVEDHMLGGINVIGKYAGSLLRIIAESVETNCAHQCAWVWLKVARDGIEPPTQGFSVLCSTNWATWPSLLKHSSWDPVGTGYPRLFGKALNPVPASRAGKRAI
jgi:hypothetical protein